MFTGLIETVKPVISNIQTKRGRALRLSLGELSEDARLGESICVNGVCLTISRLEGEQAVFDVMAETVRSSTLGELKAGESVNLERALPTNGRFGGHIVQGHIDGVGRVEKIEQGEADYRLWVGAEEKLMDLMIAKGSVALDGVSLTIGAVERERFSVNLIPTTLQDTNLGRRRVGDKVNLEADILSKWIKKRLDQIFSDKGSGGGLTMDRLREQGFV